MWDVLKEYPAARVRLEAIAVKRLEKYKKAPLEKGKYNNSKIHNIAISYFYKFKIFFLESKIKIVCFSTKIYRSLIQNFCQR